MGDENGEKRRGHEEDSPYTYTTISWKIIMTIKKETSILLLKKKKRKQKQLSHNKTITAIHCSFSNPVA